MIAQPKKRLSRSRPIGESVAIGLAAAQEVGECLEWPGPFGCHGVTPIVKARNAEKARTDNYPVAREVWTAAYGAVPEGLVVFRSCCNNACVLLDHLRIGTKKEWGAARRKAGVTSHKRSTVVAITVSARRRAIHTPDQAREVRELSAAGLGVDEIVEQTGVSQSMVVDIRSGRAWKLAASPFAGLGAR